MSSSSLSNEAQKIGGLTSSTLEPISCPAHVLKKRNDAIHISASETTKTLRSFDVGKNVFIDLSTSDLTITLPSINKCKGAFFNFYIENHSTTAGTQPVLTITSESVGEITSSVLGMKSVVDNKTYAMTSPDSGTIIRIFASHNKWNLDATRKTKETVNIASSTTELLHTEHFEIVHYVDTSTGPVVIELPTPTDIDVSHGQFYIRNKPGVAMVNSLTIRDADGDNGDNIMATIDTTLVGVKTTEHKKISDSDAIVFNPGGGTGVDDVHLSLTCTVKDQKWCIEGIFNSVQASSSVLGFASSIVPTPTYAGLNLTGNLDMNGYDIVDCGQIGVDEIASTSTGTAGNNFTSIYGGDDTTAGVHAYMRFITGGINSGNAGVMYSYEDSANFRTVAENGSPSVLNTYYSSTPSSTSPTLIQSLDATGLCTVKSLTVDTGATTLFGDLVQIGSKRITTGTNGILAQGDISMGGNDITNGGTITATNFAGTLTTAAQPNITSLGTLTGLTTGSGLTTIGSGGLTSTAGTTTLGTTICSGLTMDGDINLGGGDISNGVTIQTENIEAIEVEATTLNGTIGTAAQTNITSLGTLTGLTMSGDINLDGNDITNGGTITVANLLGTFGSINLLGNSISNGGTITATNLAGTLTTAAQTNVTSLGTLTGLTMGGDFDLDSNDITNGGTITATNLAGTLTTAAQTNITSLGTLTGLTMGGALNLNSNNITNGGTITAGSLSCTFASAVVLEGTLSTSSQTSVTSLGTLTGLTMGGTLNLNSNNITNGGTITATNLAGTLTTAAQTNITSLGTLTGLTMGGNIDLDSNNINNCNELNANQIRINSTTPLILAVDSTDMFRYTFSSNISFMQVGSSSSDTTAHLRIGRSLTTSSNIARCDIFSEDTVVSGSLSVGTTSLPNYTLDVAGTGNFSGNLTVDTNVLYVDTSTNRVGIKNSSPSYELDVSGDLYVSSNVGIGTAPDPTYSLECINVIRTYDGANIDVRLGMGLDTTVNGIDNTTPANNALQKDILFNSGTGNRLYFIGKDITGNKLCIASDGGGGNDPDVMMMFDRASGLINFGGDAGSGSKCDIDFYSDVVNVRDCYLRIYNSTDNWSLDHETANRLQFRYNDTAYGYIDTGGADGQLNFTGQHRSVAKNLKQIENDKYNVGKIVVSTGKIYNPNTTTRPTIDDSLPIIEYSSEIGQGSVFGVISRIETIEEKEVPMKDENGEIIMIKKKDKNGDVIGYEKIIGEETIFVPKMVQKTEKKYFRSYQTGIFNTYLEQFDGINRVVVNSVGEGSMWVCCEGSKDNGTIEIGDLIMSSSVPGIGMKQQQNIVGSYTIAKSTMKIEFDKVHLMQYKQKYTGYDKKTGELKSENELDKNGNPIEENCYDHYYTNKKGDIISREEFLEDKKLLTPKNCFINVFCSVTYMCG